MASGFGYCGMARTGSTNRLMIVRDSDQGFYLASGDPNQDEILLPARYVPEEVEQGDEIDVFVFRDSEDRLVATTESPRKEVGQFGVFEVVAVHPKMGAFLDWGLPKDLLLPYAEQAHRVRKGERVVARVMLDERSDRVMATTKFERFLDKKPPEFEDGQQVEALVYDRTPLGYRCVVEDAWRGLLYRSDPGLEGRNVAVGSALGVFVWGTRPEGGIDLALAPCRGLPLKSLAEQILDAAAQDGGSLALGDKSSPEEVRRVFGVSKKVFKQALGGLYKARKIALESERIVLAQG